MDSGCRGIGVLMAIMWSSALVASCGSTSLPDPALEGSHSYMSAGPSAVFWLSLDVGQHVSGTSHEVLGPGLTNDRKVHEYTDRVVGSLSGDTLTFTLVANSQVDSWGGGTSEATMSKRKIVFKGVAGDVFTEATNQQFHAAAAARMPQWVQQQAHFAQQCQTRPTICGSG